MRPTLILIAVTLASGCQSFPLRATLAPPPGPVVGGNVVLKLTLTNVSDHPVNLPLKGFVDQFVTSEIRLPDGATISKRHPGGALGHGKYPGRDMAPGSSMTLDLAHDLYSKGTYRIKCVLDTRPDSCPWLTGNGKFPWIWPMCQGRIESNTITVEVKSESITFQPKTIRNVGSTIYLVDGDRALVITLPFIPKTGSRLEWKIGTGQGDATATLWTGPDIALYILPMGAANPPIPQDGRYHSESATSGTLFCRVGQPQAQIRLTNLQFSDLVIRQVAAFETPLNTPPPP